MVTNSTLRVDEVKYVYAMFFLLVHLSPMYSNECHLFRLFLTIRTRISMSALTLEK